MAIPTPIVRELNEFDYTASKIEKDIAFYHNNDNCPKCKQGIAHEFKIQIVAEQETELGKLKVSSHKIKQKELSLQQRLDEIKRVHVDINMLNEKISELKTDIATSQRFIQRLELEKNDIVVKVGNIEHEKNKLKDLAKETVDIVKERSDLNETQHYYDIASVLLKDSGIKTRVIRKYLPVINKLVNKYLAQMDFFVQFTLDEKFDEIIKSRYRDDFSYESFSEGEKQRIDLALLFTWRTIAKLKNSASTNLLILDEIFDSSLDNSATELVMTLLNTLGEGTHVMVISHKGDTFFDKFSNVLRFQKKKNFSVIS
jgi:DNA repair exonuclease SbcCD ATPase subunit